MFEYWQIDAPIINCLYIKIIPRSSQTVQLTLIFALTRCFPLTIINKVFLMIFVTHCFYNLATLQHFEKKLVLYVKFYDEISGMKIYRVCHLKNSTFKLPRFKGTPMYFTVF